MRASIFAFFIVILEFPVRDSSSPCLVMSTDRFKKWCETWQLTSNTMSSENAENSVFLPTLILRQIILKVHEFLVVHAQTQIVYCIKVLQEYRRMTRMAIEA